MWIGAPYRASSQLSTDTNRPALAIWYFLGHRFHRFGAYAFTRAGKVVHLKYFIWIDDNHYHNMFEGTEWVQPYWLALFQKLLKWILL